MALTLALFLLFFSRRSADLPFLLCSFRCLGASCAMWDGDPPATREHACARCPHIRARAYV